MKQRSQNTTIEQPGVRRPLPGPFWILCAGAFVNRAGALVFLLLALYLATVQHFTALEIGLVLSAVGIAQMLSQWVSGVAGDIYGSTRVIVCGIQISAFIVIGLAYARSSIAVVIFCVCLGFSVDTFRPAAQALLLELAPEASAIRATVLFSWALNCGFSVALLLVAVIPHILRTATFWYDGLTSTVFAVLTYVCLPRGKPAGRTATARAFRMNAKPLKSGSVKSILLYTLLLSLMYTQVFTNLPLWIHYTRQPIRIYGLVMLINCLLLILLQPVCAVMAERLDRAYLLTLGALLVGAGLAVSAIATSAGVYLGMAVVWTLGEVLALSLALSVTTSLAPSRERSMYAGLYGMAWGLGAVVAPTLGAVIRSELGTQALALLVGGLAIAASFIAIGDRNLRAFERGRLSRARDGNRWPASAELAGRTL